MRRATFNALTLTGFSLFFCLLLLPSVGAQRRPPRDVQAGPPIKIDPKEIGPDLTPVDPIKVALPCCGKKPPLKEIPNYATSTYSKFTGQVAIATNFADSPNKPAVVIWDLTNQSGVGASLLGTQWDSTDSPATDRYSHPSWTKDTVGDIFGLTLDGSGNIYVAATRVYGTATLGSPAVTPGTPGSGDIYKINAVTGNVTRFVQTAPTNTYTSGNKIPNTGPGLGNIHYSCDFDKFYVSNFEDGKIYRIDAAGAILSLWDHGQNLSTPIPDTHSPLTAFTPLGRRPWAVQVYDGRLYYSIWSEDLGRPSSAVANEIWSVGLNASGDFTGPATREITLPPFAAAANSNPVADISFSPAGSMYLAERTMVSDTSPSAHASRLLEYTKPGLTWQPTATTKFKIGSYSSQDNAAGGCDFDNGPGGRVWATGDYLNPQATYGLQGLQSGGGTYQNSILIDLNNTPGTGDKRYMGDVEIPCFQCDVGPPAPVIAPPGEGCAKPGQYCVKQAKGVTYTWNITGGTPSTATGSCVNITWGSASPKAITVTATNAAGCTSTTRLLLDECAPPTDPCCPPWNKDVLKDVMFYEGQGSISAPYTLVFKPSASLMSQMPAYLAYLNSLNPATNTIIIEWRLYDQGPGNVAVAPGTQLPPPLITTTWSIPSTGNPSVSHANFFQLPPTPFPMQVGQWYSIETVIRLGGGQTFFPEKCARSSMQVRVQAIFSKGQSSGAVLEYSDGQKIIKTIPLTENRGWPRR